MVLTIAGSMPRAWARETSLARTSVLSMDLRIASDPVSGLLRTLLPNGGGPGGVPAPGSSGRGTQNRIEVSLLHPGSRHAANAGNESSFAPDARRTWARGSASPASSSASRSSRYGYGEHSHGIHVGHPSRSGLRVLVQRARQKQERWGRINRSTIRLLDCKFDSTSCSRENKQGNLDCVDKSQHRA